jgi:hypothetical protein
MFNIIQQLATVLYGFSKVRSCSETDKILYRSHILQDKAITPPLFDPRQAVSRCLESQLRET